MGVRRKRNEMLRILSTKKKRAFYEQFVGTTRPALLEHSKEEGMLSGFTDNYIKISIPAADYLQEGHIHQVQLDEITGDRMVSQVAPMPAGGQ